MITKTKQKFLHVCHGTAAAFIPEILKKGICPRSETGSSNWEKYPSRPDLVYLTTSYPLYFAMAVMPDGKPSELETAVIEVDMDLLKGKNMYPDEDFIAQQVAHGLNKSIEEVHPAVRDTLDKYRKYWPQSLKSMGTCAHRGVIPPEAILRYAKISLKKNPYLYWAVDPVISVMNYKFCGARYERLNRWVLGYEAEVPEVEEHAGMLATAEASGQKEMIENFKKTYGEAKQISKDRDGIELVILREAE